MNDNVDFAAAAELFPAMSGGRRITNYHRFDSLAEAVRFAVEELNPMLLVGAYIQCDEARYDADEIGVLYRSTSFPLRRDN